jgi:DNA-binding NarL/FixJ family response regulator
VLIADDHAWTRQLLGDLVDSHDDLRVVGSVPDGDAAVRLALRTRPDVVVMDVSMPGTDGVAATRRLHRHLPEARVVLLSVSFHGRLVRRAMAAGACGFLLKNGVEQALADGIRAAAAGGRPIAPEVLALLGP